MNITYDKELLLRNMLNAPGGDPVYVLDMLYDVITNDTWRTWTGDNGKTFDKFGDALVHMGQSWDKVLHLIAIAHPGELRGEPLKIAQMIELRARIKGLYETEAPAANPNGGDRSSLTCQTEDFPTKQGGNSRDYRISVLKRDAPDIAERVIAGEISAAVGWREAGKEKPRVAVRMDDPHLAAQVILEHMTPGAIRELIALLSAEVSE